jgi:hypothetical protein
LEPIFRLFFPFQGIDDSCHHKPYRNRHFPRTNFRASFLDVRGLINSHNGGSHIF